MEELLAIIIQFLIEVVGQAFISIPFDCTCRIRQRTEHHAVGYSIGFLVVGGMVGWISAAFVPALVHVLELRIAGLLLTPLVAGATGYYIAQWQSKTRNPFLVPHYHFWYAFFFTLGLVAVRFVYVK